MLHFFTRRLQNDDSMSLIARLFDSLKRLGVALSFVIPICAWPQDLVVATIDKQSISNQDLEIRAASKLAALQSRYESQSRRLNLGLARSRQEYKERELGALLDERALALESKARHSTGDALLAALTAAPVGEAQMHAFYTENQIQQPFGAVAGQIKDYLDKRATEEARRSYLDSLRAKFHAAISLEPLREPVTASGPARGAANAPVTIVEFSDFQCPFCGRFEPVMESVLKHYPAQVRLIYRNLPLSSLHPEAQKAAEAAVCAQDQGKFWEMHDLLFAEQGSLNVESLKEKARRLRLDSKTFDDCLDSGKSAAAIAVDADAAEQLAIDATPTSFVNGRYITGAINEAELTAVINDELRRVGSRAPR
jgi:protein-disulfide isomerase